MDASALDIAITALEKELSKIESSIDGLEKYLWISSTAVAVGVVLEIYFLVHEYLDDRNSWRRGILIPPPKPSFRTLMFEVASVLLVVAGIVGELWVGVISANKNADLRSKNTRLVGLVRQKAVNADNRATVASDSATGAQHKADADARENVRLKGNLDKSNAERRVEAAKLEQANIESAKALESEKRDRLAIQVELLPRAFDDQQRSADAMRPFSDIKFAIDFEEDHECRETAGQIAAMLGLARLPHPFVNAGSSFFEGVTIDPGISNLLPNPSPANRAAILLLERSEQAAAILASELNRTHIAASVRAGNIKFPAGTLFIRVGIKPTPLLRKFQEQMLNEAGDPSRKGILFRGNTEVPPRR